VGFYLDEIPLSPPALSQSGKVVIDPDLYDLERVEVLRGPQGTLYGSGSMGGTIKVITNQPKLGTFEGSVQGTGSYTDGGGGNGGGDLMLNMPIGDVLARARGIERPVPQRLDRQHHRQPVSRHHRQPRAGQRARRPGDQRDSRRQR
jgi:iron complex outermembrane receptor protein